MEIRIEFQSIRNVECVCLIFAHSIDKLFFVENAKQTLKWVEMSSLPQFKRSSDANGFSEI